MLYSLGVEPDVALRTVYSPTANHTDTQHNCPEDAIVHIAGPAANSQGIVPVHKAITRHLKAQQSHSLKRCRLCLHEHRQISGC